MSNMSESQANAFEGVAAMAFESKSAYIARMIRAGIRAGEFAEGESMRQREIAKKYGVSATPVREAFSQLQAEGYIDGRLNHGARVRSSVSRMKENWKLRAALESVAAELAVANVTEADLADIRQKAAAFASASEDERGERNREFHFAIYERAKSPVLMRFLHELWDSLDLPITGRRSHDASIAEHSLIIDAIARGLPQAASDYIRLHIEGTQPVDEPLKAVSVLP